MDADLDARVAQAFRIADEDPGALLAVVGPTASGKTELAVRLAEHTGGEIVSADSVQIYRYFDIGSGKPSADEIARAPHHLIGVLDPLEPVDAARFADLARAAIESIEARGRRPIVCGGTFLWVKALLFGLAAAPPASDEIRGRHKVLAEANGRPSLHDALARVDAVSAARLHPNDLVRVSRALEVYELTGRAMSLWQAEHGFSTSRYRARLIAIANEPHVATARITARAHAWLHGGWQDEVRDLIDRGYGGARAMSSVGYREVRSHVAGEAPPEPDLETAVVRATRVFARRQRTWLNHVDVSWV